MKQFLPSFILLFLLVLQMNAQYSETFSTANKGILSAPCTINDDPSSCANKDFMGVDWTITGNFTGGGGISVNSFISPEFFKTSGGVLTSSGDIDVEICWVSPLLDISVEGTESFNLDISYTGFDGSDYLDVEYSMDGGSFVVAQANLVGSGGHTINGPADGFNNDVGVSGLNGNTLQIRVCTDFNSLSENFTLDDVNVPESGVSVIAPCTDMASPTISCPGSQQGILDANCQFSLGDYTGLATANDDCGPVTVTQFPMAGQNQNGVGGSTVTLIATDGAGNTATCMTSVIRVDQMAPSITCPGTANRNVNANCIYSLEDFTGSAITDDNCGPFVSVSQSPLSDTNLGVGSQTVTLTASDLFGNSNTCSFIVSVTDNLPPNAVCQNGTVQLDGSGNGSINASALDGGTTDNCPGAISYVPTSFGFTCLNIGPNTVTVSVVDVSFNSTFCTAVVTVQDNIPPTAICQDATVVLSGTSATLSASQVDGGSTDNCPPPALSVSPTMFDCSDVGINPVTLLVLETSGGTGFATCTAAVTVRDNTLPTALCMSATVQVGNTLMPSQVDNGSSDNCTNPPSLSVAPNTFGCGNVGSNIVTLTVNDTKGNTSICSTIVTVESNAPPTAVCANFTADISISYVPMAFVNANDVDGGSSSDCSTVSLGVSPTFFTCSDVGPNTVTLTATDDGNSLTSTCTAVVTVEDPDSYCCAGPVAMCNAVTVFLDNTGNGSTSAGQVGAGSTADCGLASETVNPSGFDCDDIGPNTVTYTITDINGASSSCTAVVTVEDNSPPMANCQDVTVEFNGENELFVPTTAWDDLSSADNCGATFLSSITPMSVTCDQVGTTVAVTVSIHDGNGNTANCMANVYVGGLPCGWNAGPDGINCLDGSDASFNPSEGTFMVSGEGCYDPNYYSNTDSHGFTGLELCGDGEITAEVTEVNGSGFGGVSMREDLSPGSKMLQLSIDGVFLSKRELRQSTNGLAFNHSFQTLGRNWLRLTRSGNEFIAQHSPDGVNWSNVIITNIAMSNCIQVGLFAENTSPMGSMTATFDNVEINQSIPPLSTPGVTFDELHAELEISPNPTRNEAFVDIGAYYGQSATIRVFSNVGQLMQTIEIDEVEVPTQRLDLSGYQSGLYLIQVETPNQPATTRKLMVLGER